MEFTSVENKLSKKVSLIGYIARTLNLSTMYKSIRKIVISLSQTKILIFLVGVAILLRIVTIYSVNEHNKRIDSRLAIMLTQVQLKETFESMLSSFNAAESAIRGYTATGDKKFLTYYQPAIDSLKAQDRRFDNLISISGSENSKSILNDLGIWLDEDIAFLQRVKVTCDGGKFEQAKLLLSDEKEKGLNQNLIAAGRGELIQRLHEAQSKFTGINSANSWMTYMSFFSAVFLSIAVLTLLLLEIRRRKILHNVLQGREKLLQTTFNSISEGLITTNEAGKILYMNKTAEKLTGWASKEAQGLQLENIYNIMNEESGEKQENIVSRMMRTKNRIEWENNTILQSKDNVQRIISNNGAPVFDSHGKISGSVLVFRDITHEKEEEYRIAKATISAQESERQQMGLELHDNINQILVGASLTLGMARQTSDGKLAAFIETSQRHISEAMDEIRKLSHRLVPESFTGIPLNEVFQSLIDGLNLKNKFSVSFYYDDLENVRMNDDVRINLFRILQEQLKNIIKYSEAKNIEIGLHLLENSINMTVSDNGKGFDPAIYTSGIGLNNIRKRTAMMKGKFSLESAPGKGCAITVEIPL